MKLLFIEKKNSIYSNIYILIKMKNKTTIKLKKKSFSTQKA